MGETESQETKLYQEAEVITAGGDSFQTKESKFESEKTHHEGKISFTFLEHMNIINTKLLDEVLVIRLLHIHTCISSSLIASIINLETLEFLLIFTGCLEPLSCNL